jgi:hypothetical protein
MEEEPTRRWRSHQSRTETKSEGEASSPQPLGAFDYAQAGCPVLHRQIVTLTGEDAQRSIVQI